MHVVNWMSSTGEQGWHSVDDLDAAVAHVEHLRNRDGVEDASIFRLEPVAFEFKPYFRVELREEAGAPVSFAASIAVDPEPAPIMAPVEHSIPSPVPPPFAESPAPYPSVDIAPVAAHTGPDEDIANGSHRRGLFGR